MAQITQEIKLVNPPLQDAELQTLPIPPLSRIEMARQQAEEMLRRIQ